MTPVNNTNAGPPRVCIVVSRYNQSVTGHLRESAIRAYEARFGSADGLGLVEAPGAYELTALASAAIRTGAYDGVVTLGCVIRGETDHDRYISQAVASGLTDLTIATGVPVAFGVITANSAEQARARSGGADGRDANNKGAEAMSALLDTIEGARHLELAARGGTTARFEIDSAPADKAGGVSPAGSP